jgi:hypothetical protein
LCPDKKLSTLLDVKVQLVYRQILRVIKKITIAEVWFMSKASSRGFGFTAIAILVILMALSAVLTTAEACNLF